MNRTQRSCGLVMWLLVMAALMSGCATTPSLDTSTGKPEVIIGGATNKAVFNSIAEQMLSIDYLLKGRSENIAVFGKHVGTIFVGPGHYAPAERRVTFNMIETSAGIRVMAALGTYINPGTPSENLEEGLYSETSAYHIQDILMAVKENLEKSPSPSPQNIAQAPPHAASQNNPPEQALSNKDIRIVVDVVGMIIKGAAVQSVLADSPAHKAGIRKGDTIIAIDGEPAGTSQQNAARLTGKVDTSVLLKIKRGDQELAVPVIRENP